MKDHIEAKELMAMFGDISQMTLWRWLKDPELQFPQPVYFRRRRYWNRDQVEKYVSQKFPKSEETT